MRTHTEPQHGDPPSCPRPAAEGRAARPWPSTSGEARPTWGAPRQGRAGARREEERAGASPGTARRGLPGVGASSAGAGAAAARIARRVLTSLQRIETFEGRGKGEGKGGVRQGGVGQRCPVELQRLRSPTRGSPRAERSGSRSRPQQQQPLAWQQQLAGKVKRRGAAPPSLGFPLAPELPPQITPGFGPLEGRR